MAAPEKSKGNTGRRHNRRTGRPMSHPAGKGGWRNDSTSAMPVYGVKNGSGHVAGGTMYSGG